MYPGSFVSDRRGRSLPPCVLQAQTLASTTNAEGRRNVFSQTRASSAENSGTTPFTKFFTAAARTVMARTIVCWSSSAEAPFDFAPAKCACVQGPHPATADAARSTSSLVLESSTSSKRTPMN